MTPPHSRVVRGVAAEAHRDTLVSTVGMHLVSARAHASSRFIVQVSHPIQHRRLTFGPGNERIAYGSAYPSLNVKSFFSPWLAGSKLTNGVIQRPTRFFFSLFFSASNICNMRVACMSSQTKQTGHALCYSTARPHLLD